MWPSHTVEYDAFMKRRAALTQAAVWVDLDHSVFSERCSAHTGGDTVCEATCRT